MANLMYSHYSDNVAKNATWAVQTGTAETDYGADKLIDDITARPAKLQETSGAWTAQFSSQQRVDWVALPNHNLDAGLEVRIQGNATNSWGAPTFNQQIVIPAYRGDGFPPGSFLDLTGLSGYSASGFLWWRLVVVGANSVAVQVGEFAMFPSRRTLSPNISWGEVQGEERKVIEHRTDYGVPTAYDLGVTVRTWRGELDSPDTQKTAVRSWWQNARGRAYPFYLVPDPDVNEVAFVKFADTRLDVQLNVVDRSSLSIGWEEVSRGLYL